MPSLTLGQALVRLKNRLMHVKELYEQCFERSKQMTSLNILTSQASGDSLADHLEQSQYNINMRQAGRLEGIPIVFKDNFCTKRLPTTCASAMLLDYSPPYDSTMVSNCVGHGAYVMGKANMDEFAMGSGSVDSYFGPVKNPWSLVCSGQMETNGRFGQEIHFNVKDTLMKEGDWLVAGGSSGGSAAAVASGVCLAALGSDTGGSVRIPASYCGIVGFKPTYGLLSRHGLIPLTNSMDVPGIHTQTVEDCLIVMNAVAGHDINDSTTVLNSHTPFSIDYDLDMSKIHIGIPKEFFLPHLQDDMVSLWQRTANALDNAGAKVSEVSLPHFQYSPACYSVLCACDVASNFSRYDGIEFGLRKGPEDSSEELFAHSRLEGLNEVVRGRIMAGNYFLLKRNYEKMFVQAQKVRRLIAEDYQNVFTGNKVDFILAPTALSEAPSLEWFLQESNQARASQIDYLVTSANLAGLPAISLPLGKSTRGLPLGIQLTGPMFSESKLLSVSNWLEEEFDFRRLSLDFLDSTNAYSTSG